MKVIICGLGSIGMKHATLLLSDNHTIWAFRSQKKKKVNVLHIPELYTWDECKKIHPDAIFITNPSAFHIDTAFKALAIGCPLFIEKPLGNSLKDIKIFVDAVKKKSIPTYVAYHFRFHPVINFLKKYLKDKAVLSVQILCSSYLPLWHPDIDWKNSYSSHVNMGGGVLLDLSHEFDYATYLFGNITKISGIFKRSSDITVDTEDVADLVCETVKSQINIHLDYTSHIRQRKVKIDCKNQTIISDLLTGTVEEWQKEKCIKRHHIKVNFDLIYKNEIRYFMKNMQNINMMNSVNESASILEKILIFKEKGFYEG